MTDSPLAQALGRIPSGLFILTAQHEPLATGMLASWVMQAGFEPPMLTVAVRRDRYLVEWLTPDSPLVINILPEGDTKLLKHFGRGFAPDEPAFEGVAHERDARGVPILLDALGHLQCTVRGHFDTSDHRLLVAEVTGGALHGEAAPAIHVRKNGLRY